jgi:thiol-disulfide isomerase/thioredoxin
MMAEDSDASMEVDDSKSTKEEDSESAMDMDDTDSMMEESSEGSRDKDDSESTMEKEDASAMIDLPAWFDAELTDVNTEEVLAVADLQDKVVLVETMAIWCSSCLRQQKEVKALHELLGMRDDLVTLVLDIDPNEDADNLRTFAEKHGFSWFYAVVPREVAREIGQLYGDQFLNPPSTSMLIIDQHGEVHLLPFGRKTVQDLQEVLEPFLAAGM